MGVRSAICEDAPSIQMSRLAEQIKLSGGPVLPFVCERDLRALLSAFYKTDWEQLRKQDAEIDIPIIELANGERVLSTVSSSVIDPDFIPSTAASLFERVTWANVQAIVTELEQSSSRVKGFKLLGWHSHALRLWVKAPGFEAYYTEIHGCCPDVLRKHKVKAITEFLKLLAKYL